MSLHCPLPNTSSLRDAVFGCQFYSLTVTAIAQDTLTNNMGEGWMPGCHGNSPQSGLLRDPSPEGQRPAAGLICLPPQWPGPSFLPPAPTAKGQVTSLHRTMKNPQPRTLASLVVGRGVCTPSLAFQVSGGKVSGSFF